MPDAASSWSGATGGLRGIRRAGRACSPFAPLDCARPSSRLAGIHAFRTFAGAAPHRDDSLAARLKQQYGDGVDPEISLGGERAGATGGAADSLLDRIAQHGPRSPRYHLEGEVARGGMGAILKIWDRDLRRHLAMKVVLGKSVASNVRLARPTI